MSCGSEFYTSNCVCDTLLAIVEAQEKVNPSQDCAFGCNRAIQELVGGVTRGPVNTIPVILFCKSTCKPFKGIGVKRSGVESTPFQCVSGCIFKVVDVDPETCCATLEILETNSGYGKEVATSELDFTYDCICAVNGAETLIPTGVCITVDLNCFCGVSCIFPQNIR